jgi:hypothetical protein
MPQPDDPPIEPVANEEPSAASGDLAPGDFYFDGPYLVFTAAYHLKRGSCCNSGCRHCPWREAQGGTEQGATV